MIPQIKTILYATDLSAGADYAFGYALSLAMSTGARVSIINVYEKHVNQTNISMRSVDIETARNRMIAKIKDDMALYCKKEKIDGDCNYDKLVGEIYVISGVPVWSILDIAKEKNYDMIVMGTHGHGFLFNALIGSTARKIVQYSTIPVLVVRIPDESK